MPATMNISLPETMKTFVDEQVETGAYSSVSEYVRELVRKDQKERAQEKLESLLLEGLESGPGTELTPEFWDNLRGKIQARRRGRRSTG